MSEADKLAAIEARHRAATPGPWRWYGYASTRTLSLMAYVAMRPIVLDFWRWGMTGAAPRFRVDGLMVRADKLLDARGDYGTIAGIKHPDAIALERSWEDIDWLLAEVRRLRAEAKVE